MDDNNLLQLKGRIASLESAVDMLETELSYLDALLVRCGFPEGIRTLKDTVEEVLEDEASAPSHDRQDWA